MVKIEEDRQQQCKGNRKENISNIDIPEVNQPFPIRGWKERFAGGKPCNIDTFHVANMNKASEEDNGQRRPIIF